MLLVLEFTQVQIDQRTGTKAGIVHHNRNLLKIQTICPDSAAPKILTSTFLLLSHGSMHVCFFAAKCNSLVMI